MRRVDALLVDLEPRFQSEAAKIFKDSLKEAVEPEPSSRSLLTGTKKFSRKGRLNELYATYKLEPTVENRDALLVEVEAYARHATLNQSSKLDSLIKQSATQQYPQSDFSQDVVLLVMEKLSQFDDSKSLFSTWLYRVVKNARIDAIRRIKRKQPREGEFNDKFMQPAGNGGYRGSSCKSGDGAFEIKSSKRVELHRSQDHDTPRSSLADPEPASVSLSAERLALLVAELPRLDRKFIELFYQGYTLEEIAAKSFKDAKFAYNQFARIKKDLRKLAANHGWPVAIPASRKRTSVEGEIPSEPHEFATTS